MEAEGDDDNKNYNNETIILYIKAFLPLKK